MAYKKDAEVREAHPGWAVRFEDGTFLGGAHGWFRTEDAFYADIHDTPEDAQSNLDNARRNSHGDEEYYALKYEIVEAWQPICESLRHEVLTLRQANVVSFSDLMDLEWKAQEFLDEIKELRKKGAKAQPYSEDEE